MPQYNPTQAPDAIEWLAPDEQERMTIGSVLAEHLYEQLRDGATSEDPMVSYEQRSSISLPTVASWLVSQPGGRAMHIADCRRCAHEESNDRPHRNRSR